MKGGTLFSGGGGFCLGMKAAGVDHAWGVEYDDKIAQVARANGLNTITADILQCDPSTFEPVDFLHASPPCPNFSNAKANAKETDNDRALAAKVCEFIIELLPRVFTLENVYQYRNSQSWETIARTLLTHGYQVNYWHVNMADYGVPQTRKRMIAIARRDGITPMLPPATHAETPVNGFFERKAQWVGWYEAIEDLIPTLPDSEFAPWQLERLPDEFRESLCYINPNTNTHGDGYRLSQQPITTVPATRNESTARAFIAPIQGEASNGFAGEQPAQTIAANHSSNKYKAFIAPGGNTTSFSIRNGDEPARVIGDVERAGNAPRAFICAQGKYDNGMPVYDQTQPNGTVTANSNQAGIKAFITDRLNSSSTNANRFANEPSKTITVYNAKHQPPNGFANGRVVKMTPRALARFQAFPDSYALPAHSLWTIATDQTVVPFEMENNWNIKTGLACRIIGNAVPPLFAQRLVENLI